MICRERERELERVGERNNNLIQIRMMLICICVRKDNEENKKIQKMSIKYHRIAPQYFFVCHKKRNEKITMSCERVCKRRRDLNEKSELVILVMNYGDNLKMKKKIERN